MTINTGAFARELKASVDKWVLDSYNSKRPEYMEIFEEKKSSQNFELMVGFSGLGLPSVVPEGTNLPYDDMGQGFEKRINHLKYALGFIITEEAIEDSQYPVVAKAKSEALGKSMREAREYLGANVLNRAFNSSYANSPDGLELCSTAHLYKKGGTYRNELATSLDLSEVALEQMLIDLTLLKDQAGIIKIPVNGRKLIVHPNNMFEAKRILGSDLQYDNANNAINAMKSMGMLPEGYVVNRYLTDSDAYFMLTDAADGLLHFVRRDVTQGTDVDFDSSNVKYKSSFRDIFTWYNPQAIFGSPGA